MGRKKRAVHPWSSQELALAACVQSLGHDAAGEGMDAFRAASSEWKGFKPNGDRFIPWTADLLSALERKYDIKITGGLATLLWVASGAQPLRSEDRFDASRKMTVTFNDGTTVSGFVKEATMTDWAPRITLCRYSTERNESPYVTLDFDRIQSLVVNLRGGATQKV
jgi:hypothetical protein